MHISSPGKLLPPGCQTSKEQAGQQKPGELHRCNRPRSRHQTSGLGATVPWKSENVEQYSSTNFVQQKNQSQRESKSSQRGQDTACNCWRERARDQEPPRDQNTGRERYWHKT